jgi:hypothetical protein
VNKINQKCKFKETKKSLAWIVFDSGKFEIKVNQVKPCVEVKPTLFWHCQTKKITFLASLQFEI